MVNKIIMQILPNWEVGGDEILNQFMVSRLCRPNDTQNNCAREWIMDLPYSRGTVKIFKKREDAQIVADKMNDQYRKIAARV